MKKPSKKSVAERSQSKSSNKKKRTSQVAIPVTPTPIAKTVDLLVQQIAKHRQRQEKAVAKAARPSTKVARQALTAALLRTLELYWGERVSTDAATVKALTKTVKRMAGQLIKQHRKQQSPVAVDSLAVLELPLVVEAALVPPPPPIIRKKPLLPPRPRASRAKVVPVSEPAA